MKILVCGGRAFEDWRLLYAILSDYDNEDISLISGGCSGADALAAQYAREHNIPLQEFLADWEAYGLAAGPIRNQEMLDEGRPDLVIALPGGRGTADMVRRAKRAGVTVRDFG